MNKALHATQRKLIELLKKSYDEPLTIREIQNILNISSTSIVHHHLIQLEKKGYLRRNPNNPQDYQVLESSPEKQVAYINVYTLAAHCGRGESFIDGNPVDRIPVSTRLIGFPTNEAFLVRAKGDSMSPTIEDGDYVICQKSRKDQIGEGNIVVCINEDECLIKEIHFEGKNILLSSHNPKYKPRLASNDSFLIEGIARGVMGKRI